ncbi:putative polysaccharide biosynthesis protein [Dongia mobilis]|uniref:Putative polysaccharide biosynthesis protein n=1 Tax=Dongia mobilis TaxID=578943 RepID=A0A4R6WN71_9PROT|nr:sugar-transfer associated ATP-grasp domain-containing protein [Dongia mobilis]TDQ80609.1 putative polysaccharide biosynthesis protein [Dongia mobilis]
MAYLRLPFCSPYKLFWSLGPAKTPADIIHKSYASYVWSMHGRKVWPRVAFYSVAWPAMFAYLSWKHTSRLGDRVREVSGKGRMRQVWEQLVVAFCHSISPKKYYVFELFRPERYANAGAYIARYEFKGGLHNLIESRIERSSRSILNDKAAFFLHCEQAGVHSIPTYMLVHGDGRVERLMEFAGDLPPVDIFFKPFKGRGGRGCERWLRQTDGSYADQHGNRKSVGELLEHITVQAKKEPIVVQEALFGHSALRDLAINVLTTCRVMSVKNETGGYEVTHAVFKSSTRSDSVVDNFHKGGIVSRVDVATGELGPASDAGTKQPCVWFDTHPTTGATITGRQLPFWQETKDLLCRGHAAFPDRVTIGWDVAITDEGPVIVEGNVQSGCDMIQRTHDVPAGIGRLAECYAHHVLAAQRTPVSHAWRQRYAGR